MKICIYGVGAIGGYLGVQFARAGADVSLVARGAHLAAMRTQGLKLLIGDEERVVQPRCTDNPAELGHQDFVIICLKAHSITGVIEAMQPLLGPIRASSRRSMEFPTGISTSMAAATKARRWRASIPVAGNGANWVRNAPSDASSIPPPRSKPPG
jgi:pyrroline-5-carboxylate reductase